MRPGGGQRQSSAVFEHCGYALGETGAGGVPWPAAALARLSMSAQARPWAFVFDDRQRGRFIEPTPRRVRDVSESVATNPQVQPSA